MKKITNVYRKEAILQLGKFLSYVDSASAWPGFDCGVSENEYLEFKSVIKKASQVNQWFTEEMIYLALKNWSFNLSESNLKKWLSNYDLLEKPNKNMFIICAGNLPLVGFHDILCSLILGLDVQIKLSKNDDILIPAIVHILSFFNEEFKNKIKIIKDKPLAFDYVIATGSDNSNRYFEYYFGKKPHIFRKNRTSIAVLKDDIDDNDLINLSHDVLQYYGLGCRSVTKLYLPENFNLDRLYKNFYNYKDLVNHNKYMNNYDYNRSVYLLEQKIFFDNGFLILKEDDKLFSPVSVVNFEFYSDIESLDKKLKNLSEDIQCRIGVGGLPFGSAQNPNLWDYADGVDTLNFIIKN
ncbi:MAG: acyl-CoA reductase [Flavobacteriales bacterium]|nr:acyl-CoA reductase [Flavobacteriales bacterium]MDG1797188.1 acyl-CoA reductase [Flavobacteriales bacterium]